MVGEAFEFQSDAAQHVAANGHLRACETFHRLAESRRMADRRVAGHGLDRPSQDGNIHRLVDETGRPGGDRFLHPLGIAAGRQDENGGGRTARLQRRGNAQRGRIRKQ